MKVSIIIPVYKTEQFLDKCLNSVIRQSYKNIEVIVVNDGSPDNSQKIIDFYKNKDSRIISIIQENKGLSDARNTGMKAASGEFLFFLDSDDYISEDALEKLLLKSTVVDSDIIIGNFVYVYDFKIFKKKKPLEKQRFIFNEKLSSDFKFNYFFGDAYGLNACNKLYRHDFLNANNIKFEKNSEIYAEDLLFNLKCISYNPTIDVINEYTYFYNQNMDSITQSYKPNLTERFICLIENYMNHCNSIGKLDEVSDLCFYTFCIAISNSSKNVFDYTESKKTSIKEELERYYSSISINKIYKKIYLMELKSYSWKYFHMVFIFLYKRKWLNLASFLQLIRFKYL